MTLAGLFILVLAVTWAAAVIFRDDVRLKTEQFLDQQLDALVTFDDLGITILRDFPNITVTLHNLTVVGKEEFANDTLAIVDEFDFEIKTASLLWWRESELKGIHLRRPELFIVVLKNGHANYNIVPSDSIRAARASTEKPYLNLTLDQIRISDGEISYVDKSRELDALLKNVTYSGTGDFQKDVFDLRTIITIGEFTLEMGKLRYFSKKEVEIDLIMEMDLNKNTFAVKENRLRMNHFRFNVDGDIAVLADGYDLNLSFATQETDFKNIVSLVPGIFMADFNQISTQGELAFNGFITGRYIPSTGEIPSIMANFKVSDARFKIDTLPDPIENIQMELQVRNLHGVRDSTTFDLKKFQCEMRKHVVKGRIKVQGMDNLRIDTDIIADLDLAELELMYPIRGLDLMGKVDFELKAQGPMVINQNAFQKLPQFHLNMKLTNGRVKYDHLPSAIDSIQFHLVADNQTGNPEATVLDFRSLHLDLDKNRVHGFVKIEGIEDMKIKSDVTADIDLADLESMYPMEGVVMKGNLSVDVEAEGTYNREKKKFPAVDAKISLKDGFLQTKGYPQPLENIHFSGEIVNTDGNFSDTRIAINRLTYTLEQEPFEIMGSVNNLDKFDYDLKIKGLIDLEKLTQLYPIDGFELKGVIESDVETRGRLSDVEEGHYEKVVSDGRVAIKGFQVKDVASSTMLTVSDAKFAFTPSKVVMEKLEGRLGKSAFSMTGDLINYMSFATRTNDLIIADLDLKCDTLDLNQWLAEPTSTSKGSKPTNKIMVWQVPFNVNGNFDSEIGFVLYEDMRISKLNGEIELKNGVLTFHETGFNTLDAEFNISGDYDTRDIQHPLFDVALDIKELDINKAYREMRIVRELLPAAGDSEGIFSISYKLKGELMSDLYPKMETVAGKGEMRIANAKINGMKIFEELSKASKKTEVNDPHLKDFVMRSEIKDNKIFIKPFSIKVSGFDTDVEGVSEITGEIRYLVKVGLLPFGMKIPFHVTGTYDNPKVAIGKGHVLPEDSLSN